MNTLKIIVLKILFKNNSDFNLTFHLSKECEKFKTILNNKIEELNNALIIAFRKHIERVNKILIMLKYHKKVDEVIKNNVRYI